MFLRQYRILVSEWVRHGIWTGGEKIYVVGSEKMGKAEEKTTGGKMF